YQNLADRFSETDMADDLGLTPDELYLSAEVLREKLNIAQTVELRSLGRAAAKTDEALALESEVPQVQVGRSRSPRRPLFLFPTVETVPEVELKSTSVMRYHGRLADLATATLRATEKGNTTLFVMPSIGVAERVSA